MSVWRGMIYIIYAVRLFSVYNDCSTAQEGDETGLRHFKRLFAYWTLRYQLSWSLAVSLLKRLARVKQNKKPSCR